MTFSLPPLTLNTNRLEITHQIMISNNREYIIEVARYHIIPLPLIAEFLHSWLSDDLTNPSYDGISNCARTLYGRFRRSIQKILLVIMRNSPDFTIENLNYVLNHASSSESRSFYSNFASENSNWLSGNVFLGPWNRGPPIERTEENRFETFETDVEPLIGSERYQQLYNLYKVLLEYIRNLNEITPFERLTNGFSIFLLMMHYISRHDITLMNPERWEERVIFDKQRFRNNTYWTIKQEASFLKLVSGIFSHIQEVVILFCEINCN